MEHIRWLAEPALTNPVVVAAFTGWNDAGDAASTALRTLVESSSATALAEIDPDPYTDFATVRPHVRLTPQRQREIVWPTVGVWSASLPGTDVILVLGPEPALRWRSFCEQITGLAGHLGAPMAITLGALLADVPHSRPVHLIGTATDSALMERFELERSRYEGPTGIVGVLQDAFTHADIPAASLWAAVPGYAAQLPSPKAAMALVERACSMMGTPAPLSVLADRSAEYDARIASLVADDDDLSTYVSRLESMLDEPDLDLFDVDGGADELDDAVAENIGLDADQSVADFDVSDPSELVEEVEQFLRDRDEG
jgi:proteasome assembly chaperone (PAC2) family protein